MTVRRKVAGGGQRGVAPQSWGIAWFGDREAKSGICARCQRAGRVYKAYNGGQYLYFDMCTACQPKALAEQRAAHGEGR